VTSPEILKRLVRRFGLLLVLTLLGATAGGLYGAYKTPTYTAKAYVVAIGDPGDSINALNFAQAYGRVATSGPVKAIASPNLGTDRSGIDDVTASTSPDAPVIELTATGRSAAHAAAVANAMANALVSLGNTRKTDTKVTLALLAGATVPGAPTSPRPPLELAVGAAAGLLIGGLTVLAGVGRASAARADEARSGARDTAAARDEPPAVVPQLHIAPHLDGWRVTPQAAITAYRGRAGSGDLDVIAYGPMTVPLQRVVGRAPVSGAEGERYEAMMPDRSADTRILDGDEPAAGPLPSDEAGEPDRPDEPVAGRIVGRAAVAGAEQDR
jgi:capsular polysaccharide biosynthesis protein